MFSVGVPAQTHRYFDKNGNEISQEQYRQITGRPAAAPKPSAGAPSKTGPSAATVRQEASEGQETDGDEEAGDFKIPFNLVSETIIRAFERDTVNGADRLVLPIYQYMTADYTDSVHEGLSAHFQGWGRYDAGDGDFFEDDLEGALLNAYLQYARPDEGYTVKLGRQFVFKGISNVSIDGIWGETYVTPYFTASAYGGLPVGFEEVEGRSKDAVMGGRIAHLLNALYEVGVSYKLIQNDGDTVEEFIGADLNASLPGSLRVNGYSTYNLQTENWAEHSYDLYFDLGQNYVRAFYQRISYADYFVDDEINSKIFGFLKDSDEILSVIGGNLDVPQFGVFDFGASVKYYDYDIRPDAAIYAAGLVKATVSGWPEIGGELGYMDGSTPETRYLLGRTYFYWPEPFDVLQGGFFTGDAVYVLYDEAVFGKDRSIFFSLGAGMNVYSDRVQLKLSGDYSDDPYFDSDIRGMLVLLLIL